MIILFLRSPTLNMKVGRPFRGAMTALLEKMSVSARRLACAVFMNTQPSITALMMSPKMFWMINTVMAKGHSSVTILPPKPMVTCGTRDTHSKREHRQAGRSNDTMLTWTSMEKRKAEVKEWMAVTQGTGPGSLLGSRGTRSPCAKASSHQIIAKSIQEQRKAEVKMRKECCHFRSTMVVKTSCRKRPWKPRGTQRR